MGKSLSATTYITAIWIINAGISDGTWKLIEYHVNGKRTTQLFNLKNDPWERNDLSGQKKYEKTIQRLREKMAEEQKRTNDTSVFWNNFSY